MNPGGRASGLKTFGSLSGLAKYLRGRWWTSIDGPELTERVKRRSWGWSARLPRLGWKLDWAKMEEERKFFFIFRKHFCENKII
jgi:hypothetical protein